MFQSVKTFAVSAAIGLLSVAGTAQADDGFTAGSFLVRLRGVEVMPDVSSKVSPIGGHIDISKDFIPEVDLSYFFTPNIAVEAIAGTTRHSVSDKSISALGGANSHLGTVYLLPPTITAQYHFLPTEKFNPYVGAGINYTFFYDAQNGSPHSGIRYDNNFGYALQFGFDYQISGSWYANLDVKKIFLNTTVHLNALNAVPTTAKVDIDPWLVGFGLGYRF